ncbi:hypothetical protein AJ79_09144 [Helicocarpus griseus UAMH5409]|uniref:SUN domain-containing protein n=1 Tax=Helicocarpus griseus UAMH5409 TaxID=1447875 RepID=A0A2B7WM41_9EURO|nr:hypothetical protein AJ79_09144 [Helicocarpus griseus UAMH5409]
MKAPAIASMAATSAILLASVADAGHSHGHVPIKHHHMHRHLDSSASDAANKVERRGGKCAFPTDCGLVPITTDKMNAGWAMSPDQPCEPGNYCPYACPPGQVSAQWDPKATSYSYPISMNGGLYCDESGNIQKPFPEKPYCVDAKGPLAVKNEAGGVVAFCQTVLPGNENMLIPTEVTDSAELAVPGPDYWCETAAHYYINPPGTGCDEACAWGTKDFPRGNWSPYVAGANQDANGNTFIKLGWNPIYLEPATPFRNESPSFGVKIECDKPGCNGLPCSIDPSVNGVNEMESSSGGSAGAGGGAFCVVTVPKGNTANIVVFNAGQSSGGGGDNKPSSPPPAYSAAPTTSSATPSQTSTSSASQTESSTQVPIPTRSSAPSSEPATSTLEYGDDVPSATSTPTVSSYGGAAKPTAGGPIQFAESGYNTGSSAGDSAKPTEVAFPGAASATSLSVMSLTFSFLIVSMALSF